MIFSSKKAKKTKKKKTRSQDINKKFIQGSNISLTSGFAFPKQKAKKIPIVFFSL